MATITVRVTGIRQDGGEAALASVSFSLESGTAMLAPGVDFQSQVVTILDTDSAVIRIDANADLTGGTRILTANLTLSATVATIPANEAVSLNVTHS